jgi:hypothetical protein
MAADAWLIYNKFKEYQGDNTIDLDGDTFKLQLHTSTHTPALTDSVKADLDNEVANGAGYTTGGVTLGSVTWTESSGTVTFDFADPSWTASGGPIVARYGIALDDTPTSPADPLVGYSLLDNAPADVTVTDGNTLTLEINASGMFTLSGGDS